MEEIWYSIYSVDPSPDGDVYRLVESYDRKEDAEILLGVLNILNFMFNKYVLLEE